MLLASALTASADELRFPSGFLWGTATAAHQVEGGNDKNDWWDWEQTPGHIKNGDKSGLAVDHWNRYESDLDLARALNCNSYRFSIEWSRVENEDGTFNADAIAHYRAMLLAMKKRGIVPMVTLWHFTTPRWAVAKGGWLSEEVIQRFVRFSGRMAHDLGDLVDLWCTQNEPTVAMLAGYADKQFPPGVASLPTALRVYANLIRAHGLAYHAIHENDTVDADGDGKPALVGIAAHLRVFDPLRPSHPGDILAAKALDEVFNKVYFQACMKGEAKISLAGIVLATIKASYLRGTMDFIGLNYYSRDQVKFNPKSPMLADRVIPAGTPVSELNWEIYPEGIYRLLTEYKKYGKPIYITENGIADSKDAQRPQFIRDHLYWVGRAIAEGADVRGYYHWSLMDNFEWAEGYWPRFGLYTVDYADNLKRTLTEGGRVFSGIAGANAVSTHGRALVTLPESLLSR